MGTRRALPAALASAARRASGTGTDATLGSIVVNGRLHASALDARTSALNSVDLPTLGRPTSPAEYEAKQTPPPNVPKRCAQAARVRKRSIGNFDETCFRSWRKREKRSGEEKVFRTFATTCASLFYYEGVLLFTRLQHAKMHPKNNYSSTAVPRSAAGN